MHVMHIALGGCLRPPPVRYGLTEDTGGHIAYVLGAAMAQARRSDVAQVDIVTRAFDAPELGRCHARATEPVAEKCTIHRLRTAETRYLGKNDLEREIPAMTAAFLKMIRDGDAYPDVIHAHFADAAQLAEAASRAFGIPWVFTSHSLALDKQQDTGCADPEFGRVERERRAIRRADAIVASSRDESERQIVAYDTAAEGRVHCIAPGVTTANSGDTASARKRIAPFLRAPDKPIILAIARPIPKKNLVALIESYAADPWLQRRANLVILAGLREGLGGPVTDQQATIHALFDAVDRHDLWGKVALPKRHSQADIASFYGLAARGGVFVNPSRHEPFGLTLIEAARAGVPLVATRNGGPVDILSTLGAGELVDPNDNTDIARGLRAALRDPHRESRTAEAARRARTHYDWDLWADRVQNVYAGIGTAPRRRTGIQNLLASDLDGTLTGDRDAAKRFRTWYDTRADHVAFAIATGRALPEARRVLEAWALPLPDLFITSVGTEIWQHDASGALSLCPNYAAMISDGWDRSAVLAALDPLDLSAQPIYEQRRWKLSYFGDCDVADRIKATLAAAGLRARVIHSHDRLIDVLPWRAGKAAAIRFAAPLWNLDPDACVVAGDSGNDLDMLSQFERAILPANAAPELGTLRRVHRSALPHADGVLDGLVQFGLAGASACPIAAE